jgi:putative N6-adenine-specific DNA methylase
MTLAAPCLFGLESVLAYEVKKLGGENVVTSDGRVQFEGDASALARANLWLRSGERVCIVLATFEATTFQQLIDESEKIPFEDYLSKNDAFPVAGWTLRSQLFAMSSCQSIIKKAVVNRLQKAYNTQYLPETGAVHQIRFSVMKDQFTIMLDTTGTGLHKRGYRTEAGEAPIKETRAAGILDLARTRKDDLLIDPMCGSGTFVIESAMRAMNLAPGLNRSFAAESWGLVPTEIWQREREKARTEIVHDAAFQGIGYDLDSAVLALAKENAKRAGVAKCVRFEQQDVARLTVPEKAVVVCNPPYGERLLEEGEAQQLCRTLGKVMPRQPGTSYYVITPDEGFERLFGRPASRRRKLYNGMIQCQLYMFFK